MLRPLSLTLTAVMALSLTAGLSADFHTIPLPLSVAVTPGAEPFTLGSDVSITAPDSLLGEADFLRRLLPGGMAGSPSTGPITLRADLYDSNPEAYTIEVTRDGVTINGASRAGTFYGIQTLRKALPAVAGSNATVEIPAARIYDRPQFGYRGMHLDVARHFFPVSDVKTYIDMMALHGLNTLHLHLTDDQGWRIEIAQYPRLTEVGSRRPGTIIGRTGPGNDSIPVEGFYTAGDIREIVDYAAANHVQVIPEIDLPSHMLAALAAYPGMGCTGGPYEVWQRWGVSEDVLCPGNDATMQFIADVIAEVAALFPAPYIHIGGDECPKTRWKSCPRCQARIRELGLDRQAAADSIDAETLLQGYVTAFACEAARRHGKQAIGWDEILESPALPPDAVVMSWHGVAGAVEGTSRGHKVILTPSQYCYFDYFQSPDGPDEPFAVGGLNSVEHVYSLEPILPELTASERELVLGCQANLWTEYIKTFGHVQYNVLPRMAALAEVQWTDPALKDYAAFRQRLIPLMRHYDASGYNYARHITDVGVDYRPDPEARALVMTCSALPGYDIRYTLDGTEPTPASTAYTGPVSLTADCVVKVNCFNDSGKGGRTVSDTLRITPLTFGKCTLADDPYYVYAFKGAPQLVDGLSGTRYFRTGRWLGFSKHDVDATIEMLQPARLSAVGFSTVVKPVDALADAEAAELYGRVAATGEWVSLASDTYAPDKPDAPHHIERHTLRFAPVELDAVRIVVRPVAMLPPEHPQGGWPALLFIDEITAQ